MPTKDIKTHADEEKKAKKAYKDFTSLKAWQRGHELNLELAQVLNEYQSDPETGTWCQTVQKSLINSCIQLMEAYRKVQAWDKVRRYEQALFYINEAYYQLFLGQELGLWEITDLLTAVQDYYQLTYATLLRFIENSGIGKKAKQAKKVSAKKEVALETTTPEE
ncbi:MAG: hypothetical protein Q4G02_01705 [bacterium]|nr:hypothetical protein [bacterium]